MTFYDFGKRIMDIIGSICAIIIFSPLMIGVSIWIKCVSPNGPIFADIPLRVGKDKKMFRFYKFRSMIPHAHEWLVARPEYYQKYIENNYKLDPDPRLIKGAEIIRKFSIDEFAQFFNVLKGDMSIVGPRAYFSFEVEDQIKKFPHCKEHMDKALSVKPGITGVWQTSGRSKLSFEERVKLDADYATKRSLLYDLLIILKTPFVVLSGEGAY